MSEREDSKRVAKNTLVLYARMILMMFIGLFTSRVMLQALGVDNYGIQNVVGGFLGMFSILTASMVNAISRFLTVELAHNDIWRRQKVFATTVSVTIVMGGLMFVLIETVGLYFLNHGLNIPEGRINAAQWVLHCSAIGIFFGYLSIPYNSSIVAHEKMSAFAYISIFDVVIKLLNCYIVLVTPFDKLITLSVLSLFVSRFIQWVYYYYCKKHFEECRYDWSFDRKMFKKIWGFAGWNLFGEATWILNNQGINMLMNIYFGVRINAARGIASNVNEKVMSFVGGFTTSLNPQIIKSYSEGNKKYAFKLACRGARFSFFLMFIFALPVMIEANQILHLWLGNPPEMASMFVVWTILSSFTTLIGNTLVKLQFADGRIRKYQMVISVIASIPFFATWAIYFLGASPITSYWIYFAVYWLLIFVRWYLVNEMTGIPAKMYLYDVVFRCHMIALLSGIIPIVIRITMQESFVRLLFVSLTCIMCSLSVIFVYGMEKEERNFVINYIYKMYCKFHKKWR